MDNNGGYKPTPPAPKTAAFVSGTRSSLGSSLRNGRRGHVGPKAPPRVPKAVPRPASSLAASGDGSGAAGQVSAAGDGENGQQPLQRVDVKRPKSVQRGFYSEVVGATPSEDEMSQVLSGPQAAGNTLVSHKKKRVATQREPSARSFARPDTLPDDGTGMLVEETRPEIVAPDAPENDPSAVTGGISTGGKAAGKGDAYEPKVMAPYHPGPGKTPRKIEIERKKRLFAAQDIEMLLRAEGIDYSIPQSMRDKETAFPTYLPLEAFDDNEFESRSPDEWLALGMVGTQMISVPAKAVRFEAGGQIGTWVPCKMLAYNVDAEQYLVQWEDSEEQEHVSRINLLFLAEDPFQFVKRVVHAHKARREAESMLRYNLYIDSMPTDEIPPLDTTQVKRILSSALNTKKLKGKKLDTSLLVKEVNKDYARAMNKIIFDINYSDPSQADLFDALHLPPLPEKAAAPMLGTVPIPEHNFPEQFSEFTFHSFLTKPEVISAIVKVRGECNRILSMSLFNTFFTKSVRLDEFEQMQSQAHQQVVNNLKESWITTLKNAIKNSLQTVGKGWFNLQEKSKEVYEMSKLKKFMVMINFCMQDSLRFLAEASIETYVAFLENAATGTIVVESPSQVTAEYDDDAHRFSARKNPLFLVDLVVKDNEFTLSTAMDQLEDVPMQIFDRALSVLQDIPQLEPMVMADLFWAHKPVLASVHRSEDEVDTVAQRLNAALKKALEPLQAYIHTLDEYVEFVREDPADYIKQFQDENASHTIDQLKAEVNFHLAEQQRIESSIPVSIPVGMFTVNVMSARNFLADKRAQLAKMVLEVLAKRARDLAEKISGKYNGIFIELQRRPECIEELQDMQENMLKVPDDTKEAQAQIDVMKQYYEVVDSFSFALPPEEFNMKWNAIGWPRKISERIEEMDKLLEHDKSRFQTDLVRDQESYGIELEELTRVVNKFSKHTDIDKVAIVAEEVERIQSQLKNCEAKAAKYNSREALFEFEITEYSDLDRIVKTFQPYADLWSTANKWINWEKTWLEDPFHKLDPEQIDKDLGAAWKVMYKSVKFFQDKGPGCLEIATDLKQRMDDFKPHMPLITNLRNPGMRDRHWLRLQEETGHDLAPSDDQTLSTLIKLDLEKHMESIEAVCDLAGKEYSIEEALDKMETEWSEIVLEVHEYRETGTHVMKMSDDITQMLDDHIAMTQSMGFSAFKKPFEERIPKWEAKLTLISDILDEWLACQRQWLYLEPIFSSDDINRQMPTEGKRFSTVDRMWRKIMQAAAADPNVMKICSQDKLLENFQECNKLLDLIQKGLSDYLETKRSSFPRFYFLSNDEMLEILSQTKDPTAVQPHLRKVFEAIASIDFEGDDLKMTAMNSVEKEKIAFSEALYPHGNVEHWLLEVEKTMQKSLQDIMGKAVGSYKKAVRTEWVEQWPGQIVIAASQIWWTTEVETAIRKAGVEGLQRLLKKLLTQLDGLTELVRGQLAPLSRLTLGALIVIDVHAREVVKRLIAADVSTVHDFDWMSQLRYYWEDNTVVVRMVNATFKYGYEYLGNSARLVITPLTDRCYMTLMGALHLHMGGAPAGPAGTGKTETTKDLAKALAKQCVVFNCSDGLDYLAMGKFFKGLASAGAWACFDEFNRIDLEVLSVIAQQIMTIQKAIQMGVKRFLFEGVEIALDPTCAVFITMNPGYAGRTELPDNLKALFRPVAMMVPDYALIGEIMLFSYGFGNAYNLARKMVATFRLSSEQLSSQDHYDFGMRAVKTVISAAGNLKRADPDMNEDLLLLRALKDSNVPKFLSDDIPLFNGIISDLFPGVEEQDIDYGRLLESLDTETRNMGLQCHEAFTLKCIQLYDTLVVRHGVMLVGPTGGGKTSNYRVLARALTALKDEEGFDAVHFNIVNPKSITMGQLYGQFDPNTHEWTDGVLAALVRSGASSQRSDKSWMIFDGPVDAIWIENMNTVLDDNKKLCLNSGEIIKLAETQSMIFEVEDLAVASPATVSRCGMVYMEPSAIGSAPLVGSFIERLPPVAAQFTEKLQALFDTFLELSLKFLRREIREPCPTVNPNLCQSLFNVLGALIEPYVQKEGGPVIDADVLAGFEDLVEPFFLFSLIWSVGATTDTDGQAKFDLFLREAIAKNGCATEIPSGGTVYDFKFEPEEKTWVPWMQTIPEFVCDAKSEFSSILVPTVDSIRTAYLFELLAVHGHHVLCVGNTGTGKSVNMRQKLLNGMPETFLPVFVTFSARTSANQTQDILDGRMDRLRKGVFGPPRGKRYVVFVDDLNMPAREVYGAQPPVELLRQFMDHKGWYDRRLLTFREIAEVQFCAAMGPPGGGRNPVTNRFLRHFNLISYTDIGTPSLIHIYSTILGTHLNLDANSFSDEVRTLLMPIVEATVEVYRSLTTGLLPTPSKSHYTFNLRDLAKVFQGLLLAKQFQPVVSADVKRAVKRDELLRLWSHETTRVFQDRLVNLDDRSWFQSLLRQQMTKHFGMESKDIADPEELLFGDFLHPNAMPRLYAEVTDLQRLSEVIQEYLEDYNAASNQPMRLVMFKDAIKHVSRISRIIRQPQGHALLLGVGGSGRQSLTRLAASMAEYAIKQIEVAKGYGHVEWREDLKATMFTAGLEDKPVVFLFTDTQIVSESFLEDINNVLNEGDVPNMYNAEDMDNILNSVRNDAQKQGVPVNKTSLYDFYISRVRKNIHCVICFSPVGETFRNRLRMFPALVNCCTIDWFDEWPQDALRSVARELLGDVELGSESVLNSMVELCSYIHGSVATKSAQYLQIERRFNYVTPTSYLELISSFKTLLAEKRTEIGNMQKRLEIGLDKLESTAGEVAVMQDELQALQPELVQATKEVDELMVIISRDKKAADVTKADVSREKAEAAKKTEETKAIAEDAQRDLDEALPALDAAVQSLKSLEKKDITEVKSMQRPPPGVKLVMEAVCIMKGMRPKKVDGEKPGEKVLDYWEPSRQLLNDPKFLDSLFSYDKDNIPESVIDKIEPFIDNENFQPAAVAKVSRACTSLCLWVRAMEKYYHIAKAVAPKRERLRQAQSSLEETLAALNDAKARLQEVEDSIRELEAKHSETTAKKDEYGRKVDDCQRKLDRAQKLISGLGGEKDRWTNTIADLQVDFKNLIGDVIISSGFVAYLGAFTASYRVELVDDWRTKLVEWKIPHTAKCTINSTLGDAVKIRQWNIHGLPTDGLSIENGIIISKARRWPLMIDPQGQANKWTKNMEKDNGLDVIRLSERDFLRTLENGVRFGKPVLLENIEEEIDPALEPLLLKQTFKQGGAEVIRLGDAVIPYHPDFRLYITTKLRNPHYRPEAQVKVSLLNFTITQDGLEDQLLGIVVAKERPDLEEMKNQLVLSNAKMRKELKDLEDKILELLSTSQGNILDDETLIDVLAASKQTSEDILIKVAEAEKTEVEIDSTRQLYRPVAYRSAILFFCIADLALIDPMYQYSLNWFISLFTSSIGKAPASNVLDERLVSLNNTFTEVLYANVCRSLFEKHKLLFSFLLCTRIMQGDGKIDMGEYRYLLTGATKDLESDVANPAPEWLTGAAWNEVLNLAQLPAFAGFERDFVKEIKWFKTYFDSNESHRMGMPGAWSEKLTFFQKMLILRALRSDLMSSAIQDFVEENMGREFVEPPTFSLSSVFGDSSPTLPLIFVLSAGSDPAADLYKFADEMRFSKKLSAISLGQGQGPRAEAMMREAVERGTWVLLQNCHLAISWMPALERFCENIQPDKVHRDFRLWLTSMPSDKFPVTILQNGVKMTNEPPKGLRANLMQSYAGYDDTYLNGSKRPEDWKKLLFGLCFFHAAIIERRKYGALGWNIQYEFTRGDLQICERQLNMFLEEYENIPWKVLKVTAGDINYGGRVTDDWDRRTLMTLLDDYYQPAMLRDDHLFSAESPEYVSIPAADAKSYRDYIKSLPLNEKPDLFGLHANADMTYLINETRVLFDDLLLLQPRVSATGGKSRDEIMAETAHELLTKVPPMFDMADITERYPISYEDSMTTVLTQECIRYNRVLKVVKQSLGDLIKAIKGLVVMSKDLEAMGNALYDNQVPTMWAKVAYPSMKPLSTWILDLNDRIDFIRTWSEKGKPVCYWMSGFFFPQAFLTGTLQNTARKYQISVDTLSFEFEILKEPHTALKTAPEDGCFIYGLYLEGARWDAASAKLMDSNPKELYTQFPTIKMVPKANLEEKTDGFYKCPVYKILTRQGTLSTTGHSTNYCFFTYIPCEKGTETMWVKRGVALFCALAK